MAKEIEVVANENWKGVKVGTKFFVTQEIYDSLERKNFIGEVKPSSIEVLEEKPTPKRRK